LTRIVDATVGAIRIVDSIAMRRVVLRASRRPFARVSTLRYAFTRVDERRGLRVRVRSDVVKKVHF
jgi:hypothetical protein